MAEQKKSSKNKQPPQLTRQKSSSSQIADRVELFHAIDGFVRGNCNFESSIPVNIAIEDIGKCGSLQAAFMIPLQRQLFNMEAALRWALFLVVAPEGAEKEGDEPFDEEFSSQDALLLIAQVYDIGVQEMVWDHFEPDDEDEDEDEDGEDGEDDAGGEEEALIYNSETTS